MNNVSDVFEKCTLPVSFEMFPPKGELTLETARTLVQGMSKAHPNFISVTCSAGGSGNSGATNAIAAMIQDEFNIPAIAHLTCINATEDALTEALADMKARNIQTVLALRGDLIDGQQPSQYLFAKDLIPILRDAGFCVGAAAYPEGHLTCEDARLNIDHLKQKQEAGAQFFVTQLAFDNECIYRFLDQARKAGVTVPITIGIMPFMSKSQISRMVFMCGASLPAPVIKLLAKYEHDEKALQQAGVEYACKQLIDLAQHGVDGLHVYAMNKPEIAQAAVSALQQAGFHKE